MLVNESWVIKKEVKPGFVDLSDSFEVKKEEIVELKKGEALFKVEYVSVDPFQRLSILPTLKIGSLIPNRTVMRVEKISGDDCKFKVGDYYIGWAGWTKYVVTSGVDNPRIRFQKIDPLKMKVSPSLFVGVLGMPGQTAYGGINRILKVTKSDVVVITGAAGAVGSIAGQIAKNIGAKKVIGICGSDDKVAHIVNDLGYDAAINYKKFNSVELMQKELLRISPSGIDCYFDNVGGFITASMWDLLKTNGRVAVCGQISTYNLEKKPKINDFLSKLIYKRINIRGFVMMEFLSDPKFIPSFYSDMTRWLGNGEIKFRETLLEGFENIPSAFDMLFRNTEKKKGKIVVKL